MEELFFAIDTETRRLYVQRLGDGTIRVLIHQFNCDRMFDLTPGDAEKLAAVLTSPAN